MRHPAEFYIKYLLISEPAITDAQITMDLQNHGILKPMEETYYRFLRTELPTRPAGFDPTNKLHLESSRYIRDAGVYDLFFTKPSVEEAFQILSNSTMRQSVERMILASFGSAQLDIRTVLPKINKKNRWNISEAAVKQFQHFFWNVKLLTFDEWGRFLYERSLMYDDYLSILRSPTSLAYYHLRLDQIVESKKMIQRAQEIAYFALEQVNQVPGVRDNKVKSISMLSKSLVECHMALSTGDMAMAQVLKEFEKFRMIHPESPAKDIKQLAPSGNYSGSGAIIEIENPEVVTDRSR